MRVCQRFLTKFFTRQRELSLKTSKQKKAAASLLNMKIPTPKPRNHRRESQGFMCLDRYLYYTTIQLKCVPRRRALALKTSKIKIYDRGEKPWLFTRAEGLEISYI